MLEIFDFDQGSPQWYKVRLGIPTASVFAIILGVRKDSRSKATRQTLLRKLAGEIVTGDPMENYTNDYMERGKRLEDEARTEYEFLCPEELQRVGFMLDSELNAGCSPDALVGSKGMLEIKTKSTHILQELREYNDFPPEHRAQCQGALWIARREWIDLFCYCPKMAPYMMRAYRDEEYIDRLALEVQVFNEDLLEQVGREMRLKQERAA